MVLGADPRPEQTGNSNPNLAELNPDLSAGQLGSIEHGKTMPDLSAGREEPLEHGKTMKSHSTVGFYATGKLVPEKQDKYLIGREIVHADKSSRSNTADQKLQIIGSRTNIADQVVHETSGRSETCPNCEGHGARGIFGPVGFGAFQVKCEPCKGQGFVSLYDSEVPPCNLGPNDQGDNDSRRGLHNSISRNVSKQSLQYMRREVSRVTPSSVRQIASRQLWPRKYVFPNVLDSSSFFNKSSPYLAIAIVFFIYWLTWYVATMFLASRIHFLVFAIPLILVGMCCIFPLMGSLELLNCCSFFTFGCAWMALATAAVLVSSASTLTEMSTKGGISVNDKHLYSDDAFYFTDGYLATRFQQEGSRVRRSNKQTTTINWKVAPVFSNACEQPNCSKVDFSCPEQGCIDREVKFVAFAIEYAGDVALSQYATNVGNVCPSSDWEGICGHVPVHIDEQTKQRVMFTCRQVMMETSLFPVSVCDEWPYLELGDSQHKGAEGMIAGQTVFFVAAALLACSCFFSAVCGSFD